MNPDWNPALLAAAALDALAALLHLGCIAFGAPWYRFFGADEKMARLAEAGRPEATLVTSGIVVVLAACAVYALSGAGVIGPLPLRRTVLCAITGIFLLRGLGGFALMTNPLGRTPAFWAWSSAICLGVGLLHARGLQQAWARL